MNVRIINIIIVNIIENQNGHYKNNLTWDDWMIMIAIFFAVIITILTRNE